MPNSAAAPAKCASEAISGEVEKIDKKKHDSNRRPLRRRARRPSASSSWHRGARECLRWRLVFRRGDILTSKEYLYCLHLISAEKRVLSSRPGGRRGRVFLVSC